MSVDLSNRTHGKAGTYTVGCRCVECREAWRQYTQSNLKQAASKRARTRLAKWVHDNHPDVYDAFISEARAEIVAERAS